MKDRRTRLSATIACIAMVATFLMVDPAGAVGSKTGSRWVKVGGVMKIDVPAGYGSFLDIDVTRAGVQTFVVVYRNSGLGRIRFMSGGTSIGEAPDGGFKARQALQAGFRAFAWGQDADGSARLWTPAFDTAGSLLSLDPVLPCSDPLDASTAVAGPFTITIPAGAKPGGRIVPSPTQASVFGVAGGVEIRNESGIRLGLRTTGSPTPRGGFVFADTIFAYGDAGGVAKLWTPALSRWSTALVERNFVACVPTPPGTISVTEHLVPTDDPGRFDLQIDGETKAAAVGDLGSTGPVSVSDGEHSVAESAAAGANMDDYAVGISCTEDTNPASPLSSSSATLEQIPVTTGDDWRCDITSTRVDDTVDVSTLTVGSTPETEHATSQLIGTLGGTVEATSVDGTRYSLWISPGALDTPTAITLTPTAVSGLESIAEATSAAVEFAPAGLTFAFPAQLTITPAPGAPTVDFAATWEDGAPGVEIGSFRSGPGGSIVIDVPHFSGLTTIKATTATYDNLLTLAILQLPSFGGLRAQLATDVVGLPATNAAVVSDVQGIYDGFVKPLIDNTRSSLQDLRLASRLLGDFEQLYNVFPISAVQVTPPPNPTTLQDLLNDANSTFSTNATDFVAHYTTSCDAQVADLTEWFAVPLVANAEIATRGINLPYIFCVRAEIDTLSWPTRIDPPQTSVSGSIRGVVSAPPQTPGGILKDGRALFPQSTQFILQSTAGTFAGGGSDLDETTDDDGMLDLQLDRDPGPQGLIVDGIGKVGGIWAEAVAHSATYFAPTMPVHLVASTGTISVSFRSPPTDVVLPFGQTTNLCVDVADGDNNVLASTSVEWTNDGPGLLAGTTSTTNNLGIACMDYQHPAGFVTQGDTDTITATATSGTDTGSDEVTLTPQWAHITIETRPDSQSPYTMTTNTTVHVNPGDHVQLRVTLTQSGATPTDQAPLGYCEACPMTVRIENGGGELRWISENITCVDCFVSLDANDQVELDWDPQGTSADTTIFVNYPPLLLGGHPGVAATVTFAQQNPPGTITGTITGGGSCGLIEGPCTYANSGDFRLSMVARLDANGKVAVDSLTGHLNWAFTVLQNDTGITVCNSVFSANVVQLGAGFAGRDPDNLTELDVSFTGTMDSCGFISTGVFQVVLRVQQVSQVGQQIVVDFNGTTRFPRWNSNDDESGTQSMTVSGFVPLT